ncbi:ribonuclease SLFN12-like [Acomys russatus]|uniref:ribonuclease SLFN12-like n=1 Tax=Acomys russatus TaxID=60746 RepID=UPI0021E29F51|nr:ribonuclease SLFN12-like [Acomys russatus]
MSIIIESITPKLVLNVGKITLGVKNREEMKKSDRMRKQNKTILTALCALLNSGGGEIKAHIENQDYSLTKHGIGQDLETSLNAIEPSVQKLDFKQEGGCITIIVKAQNLGISGGQPATRATNLYRRNGASSVPMDLDTAWQFFDKMRDAGERLRLAREVRGNSFREGVQEERDGQELAAAFFKETKVSKGLEFPFSESKNVEYKLFQTKKWLQRVKEILPKTVSAFANTNGGYLFIGLGEKKQQVVGFEAEEGDLAQLESETEKCVRQLPVTHFCEEKGTIKYTSKFIEVHESGSVCSYVYALRVERFCCAVFSAEPDSWHVEDSCVKGFAAEEWVKRLLASKAGSERGISN